MPQGVQPVRQKCPSVQPVEPGFVQIKCALGYQQVLRGGGCTG